MSDTGSNSGHTSYIGTVITAARALDAYGLDGTATLVEAGIDVNATPAFDARAPSYDDTGTAAVFTLISPT